MAKFVKYFAFILFLGTIFLVTEYNLEDNRPVYQNSHPALTKAGISRHLTVAFVGDIMLDRGVENSVNKNFEGNYDQLFEKVSKRLQSYDLLFGNLEGPVSDEGTDGGGIYSFRFDPIISQILRGIGLDVLSVANNHTFNWGRTAFTDTLERLTVSGIKFVGGGFDGPEAYEGVSFNVSEVKFGILGFSEFTAGSITSTSTNPGIAIISEEEIKKQVQNAKFSNDFVIVSFHFGTEYERLPNDYQIKYAHMAVDAGADLIIGHHPHVMQTLEKYKDSYIIYSLGNFIFDQYFSAETMQGGLLEVEINPTNKKIEKINLKKVQLNKYFQIESIE